MGETRPHEVLGLEGDAAADDVKDAYRRLAKALHPDVGGSRVLFEQVQSAYERLQDVEPEPPPRQPDVPVPVPEQRVSRRVALRQELQGKPREQWVVEGLFAAQLTVGGVGVLTALLR